MQDSIQTRADPGRAWGLKVGRQSTWSLECCSVTTIRAPVAPQITAMDSSSEGQLSSSTPPFLRGDRSGQSLIDTFYCFGGAIMLGNGRSGGIDIAAMGASCEEP